MGLYGSDDGGATWVALGPTAAIVRGLANTLSKYVNVVAVDPADASVVYLGGVNLIRVSGLDFTQTANGTVTALTGSSGPRGGGSDNEEDDDSLFAGSPHVDHHAIVFDAAGNLIDATDAGPWRLPHPSTTAAYPATSWVNLNGRNDLSGRSLGTIQVNGIALDPTSPGTIFGGTQDNGSPHFVGTLTWLENPLSPDGPIFGDGAKPLIERLRPTFVWVQAQRGRMYRSTDGGTRFADEEFSTNGIAAGEKVRMYPPITQVAQDGAVTVAVGRESVYETAVDTVDAVQWANTSGGPLQPGALVSALAYAPGRKGVLYAGTDQGTVYVRATAGTPFTLRSAGLPTGSAITGISVDPRDSGHAWCTVSGTGTPHVFRTTDAGASWTDISSGLPDLPAYSIVIDDKSRVLYLATFQGVFASTNDGASWTRFGVGLPNVLSFDLVLDEARGILAVATYGRGVWEVAVRPGVTVTAPPPGAALFSQSAR